MAWAPGGLERIFAQYDKIKSRHHADHQAEISAMRPPAELPKEKSDEPPWYTPQVQAKETDGRNGLFDRMEVGEQRLKTKEEEADDLKNREKKQRDGFDPWNRQDAANEKLQHDIKNPNGASFQEDEDGLVNAYKDKTSTGVYYDPATRTEYVKGSVTGQDWKDDFTKVPAVTPSF